GKWLKFVDSENAFWTETLLKLPENYTVEFDVIPIKGDEGTMGGYVFRLIKSINPKSYDTGAVPGKGGFKFQVEYFGRPNYRAYLNDYQGEFYNLEGLKEDESLFQKENRKYHIAIWVQKSRLRLYQDENKLFDIQKAFPDAAVKMDRIRFEEGAALISNIRIATGNPDMRNKLITEGKLVTYGIYFDVNKDVVKPESIPTLKEIAQVLSDNPTVRVKIVGHTDSDGEDAKNLDLSKRRGASVKKVLENTFGIQSGRLESDGLGVTKPVAPNDNPSNKALNRRVEFVKL
ncbi:MAG TPA: OmpA family protein, partial [Kaistella sp.]|nr:OmpA family protein [Kaistella sp.]